MGSHHTHHHHTHPTGKVLGWSLAATVGFVIVEAVAGIQAHSLALLSDAGHNLTDALALGLAVIGFALQSRPANTRKTYGYQRAGVLAAFVNALTLVLLSGFIFWESYHRLLAPRAVEENTMIVVAAAGLVVNLAIMRGLNSQKDHDVNVRAAWLHMLGDALGSIAIIGGAFLIRYTGWERIDPVLSILIGGLIIWTARDIIRETLNILLEGLPAGIHFNEVISAMRSVRGVIDIHDLHIWTLGTNTHALSCHVLIEDQPASSSESILLGLNRLLRQRFGINHTTMQFEHKCAVSPNCCALVDVRRE